MPRRSYPADEPLRKYPIKNFSLGYNSYAASKTLIKDEEIPYGKNVLLDDNGSVTKRNGSIRYGGEILSGKAPKNGVQFKNTSVNELIVGVGTKWMKLSGSNWSELTGLTFTDDQEWDFCMTIGRLYGCNGVDKLAYYDGATITEQTTNGNIGNQVVSFNSRLYMTNSTYPDRLYYSNPYSYDPATAAFSISNFGTFNTDLSASPKKNAGYIMLDPGSGLRITKIKVYSSSGANSDVLYVWTNKNLWKITPVAAANSDGSIAHYVQVIVDGKGTPAPKSVIQVGNDIKFFDYDNIYSLGEQAQYSNIRISTLSGRIKSEINEVTNAGRSKVALGFFKDKIWFSYMKGTYNDRVCIHDVRLNAWSPPFTGLNIGWFLDFEESEGVHKWLGGSSDPNNSYVYELDSGTDDVSTAVDAAFESKSLDCGLPGQIKRFAFIDVFYALIFGKITYEVFIDEVSAITGTLGVGTSQTRLSGCGTQVVGTFLIGLEYSPETTFATTLQNSSFRIECNYTPGKRISVRFSNNVSGEQFKINSMIPYYLEGSIYEQ